MKKTVKKVGESLLERAEHIHFIGIGGYGMSAIARVMLEMGYRVTGSDVVQQELTEKLVANGAQVYLGHQANHVQGADLVVYSTAIASDDVELLAAQKLNIPVLHRSEMLARLMHERKGIAVAGAHGKTTTSSMIALVMAYCELDPTYIIGGEIMNVGSNAKAGRGEYVVAEADESDGSFLAYHPLLAIVTNIEADHLENYDGDFGKLKSAYAQFLSQVLPGGKAIICLDDPHLAEMSSSIRRDVITFGIDSPADYSARDVQLGDRKISFAVEQHGVNLGRLQLAVPGRHNVYNALATLIVCLKAGLSFAQVADAIKQYKGTKRRFQVIGDIDDILIIDDYAHHPTEIKTTITAAKATGKRIIAVFQPQRYSRTFFLFEQFSRAFQEADEVIITDIYSPAGEAEIEGVTAAKLVELIKQNSNPNVSHIATKKEATHHLGERVQAGDLVLTMGAGDIWQVAADLTDTLQAREG